MGFKNVEEAIEMFISKDPVKREEAANYLRGNKAVNQLAQVLTSGPDPYYKCLAAMVLGDIGDPNAVFQQCG